MKASNVLTVAVFALFVMGILFAQTTPSTPQAAQTQLKQGLGAICGIAAALLPVIAFVLFILAGVAYAAGNFFGADARAKSVGWAMNMITGAVIAFLLWIIGPSIIAGLSGQTVTYSIGATNCGIN